MIEQTSGNSLAADIVDSMTVSLMSTTLTSLLSVCVEIVSHAV